MRFFHLKYILLFLFTWALLPGVYGQKEAVDTVSAASIGPAPKADEVFFNAVKASMIDDTVKAKELFEEFVKQKPEVSDAWYELARLYEESNPETAETDIKEAIRIADDNRWYKEEYAAILGNRGAYAAAAKIMSDLTLSEPEDPNYPIITAEYYERAQQYKEAIEYLNKSIARNGPDEDILMKKVQLYLDLNNVDKAADVVEQLITQDPKNGKYYKELGDLYDNNKLPAKAGAVYERAQKIIPDDPSVEIGYAEHYLTIGDTASYFKYVKKAVINNGLDAETQLKLLQAYIQSLPNNNDSILKAQGLPIIRELVAQHPANAQVLAFYGEFLQINNQRDSALLVYKLALSLTPSNFDLWKTLLNNYADPQGADSLIKYSEKAARLFPNQAIVYFYNGIGHFYKKDYTAAIKSIKRSIDLEVDSNPDMLVRMYSLLADVYHQAKQDDQSDAAFEKALQLDPDNALVLNNYSYYLSERGKKLDEAARMSKKSLALKPDEATFLDTYGWILYQTGDYKNAKVYIQKAIDMAGAMADATLYDHMGNVYFKLKDKDKAIEYWKLAKEKGAEDPQIDKKISEGKLYE